MICSSCHARVGLLFDYVSAKGDTGRLCRSCWGRATASLKHRPIAGYSRPLPGFGPRARQHMAKPSPVPEQFR